MENCIDFTLFCNNLYKKFKIKEIFNHYDNQYNPTLELFKISNTIIITFTADNSITTIQDLQDNEILLSLYKDKPNNMNIDKFIHDLSITCFYKHYRDIKINLTFRQQAHNFVAICSSEFEPFFSFKKKLKDVLNDGIAYNSEATENEYFE